MDIVEEIQTFQTTFLVIIAIIIISCIILYCRSNKKQKILTQQKMEEEKEKYNSLFFTECNHVCGLPLTKNSKCILHLCNDKISVESLSNVFILQKDRIVDINIKTSKEVQNSISGAIGGYMLLGPIGAFLGGSSTEFHRFLIIIYKSKEDKEKCISFDLKDNSDEYKKICDYVNDFKSSIKEKIEIEL